MILTSVVMLKRHADAPPPPKEHEINKPLGGLIEDLRYIKHISLRIPHCHTYHGQWTFMVLNII